MVHKAHAVTPSQYWQPVQCAAKQSCATEYRAASVSSALGLVAFSCTVLSRSGTQSCELVSQHTENNIFFTMGYHYGSHPLSRNILPKAVYTLEFHLIYLIYNLEHNLMFSPWQYWQLRPIFIAISISNVISINNIETNTIWQQLHSSLLYDMK